MNSTKIGMGLYLEIQRGKVAMENHEFVDSMKKLLLVVHGWKRGPSAAHGRNEQQVSLIRTWETHGLHLLMQSLS